MDTTGFPYIRAIVCTVLAVPGILLAFAGISEITNELSLRTRGVVILARAVDWKTKSGQNWTQYSLRYTFHLPDDPVEYSSTDVTGRKNLWFRVTEAAWRQSKKTSEIEVVYLPSNPRANRPLAPGGARLGDPITGALLGIGLACLPLYFAATAIRRYIRSKGTRSND